MNKAFKVIWSHARKCYVVVSEIAKNHGRNNTRSIVSQLATHAQETSDRMYSAALAESDVREGTFDSAWLPRTAAHWIVPLMTVGIMLQATPGFASVITDAGNKSLTSGGKVHDIYTQQILSNERFMISIPSRY